MRSAKLRVCFVVLLACVSCGDGPLLYLGDVPAAPAPQPPDAGLPDADSRGDERDLDDDDLPCVAPSDCAALGSTPHCSEARAVCVECLDDSHCDADEHCDTDGDCEDD